MIKKAILLLTVLINLLLLTVCTPVKSPSSLNPVILVPGDGGSQFEARLNKPKVVHIWCTQTTTEWYSLWLNLELLAPYVLDCFVDNIRLRYDNVTRTTLNQPGVEIRQPGFGNTSTVEWLDSSQLGETSYFYHIVEHLVNKLGYVRDRNIRGAPYDFRKAPNEMSDYMKRLQSLIVETYEQNGNQRVVLIGHSMGNLYILYLLNHLPQPWKDQYIKSFISLAAPWGGAAKTLRLMTSGDNLGVFVVNALTARAQQRSMPSTAWLMPSNQFWNDSEILIYSPHHNYTVRDYKQLFADIEFTDGYLMHEDTVHLTRDLQNPGVELHCLHGHGIDTPAAFSFTPSTWYSKQPKVISGDGDGTVNLRSLLGCLKWTGDQSNSKGIVHQSFAKAEHLSLLGHAGIKDYIASVLSDVKDVKIDRLL